MSRPTQAKYCPRCQAMNFVEAETCVHCGHQFRTGVAATPPPQADLNKTQMFMLPPAQRPAVRSGPPAAGGRAKWVSLFAILRASPLLPIIAALAVVILALIGWAVIAFR